MARVSSQNMEKINSWVIVEEASKKTQKEYTQLRFIPSLQSDIILVFVAPLRRSNVVVQMYQQLPHMNFSIV